MKLQINRKGAWKDTAAVCRTVESLAIILGTGTTWSYLANPGDQHYYRHGTHGQPWRTLEQERIR